MSWLVKKLFGKKEEEKKIPSQEQIRRKRIAFLSNQSASSNPQNFQQSNQHKFHQHINNNQHQNSPEIRPSNCQNAIKPQIPPQPVIKSASEQKEEEKIVVAKSPSSPIKPDNSGVSQVNNIGISSSVIPPLSPPKAEIKPIPVIKEEKKIVNNSPSTSILASKNPANIIAKEASQDFKTKLLLAIFDLNLQPRSLNYLKEVGQLLKRENRNYLKIEDIDTILRAMIKKEEMIGMKEKNERSYFNIYQINKFIYLYETYERVEKKYSVKTLSLQDKEEISKYIFNYFHLYLTDSENAFEIKDMPGFPTPPQSPTISHHSQNRFEPTKQSYYALTEKHYCHFFFQTSALQNAKFMERLIEKAKETDSLEKYFLLLFRYIHHKNFDNSINSTSKTISRIKSMKSILKYSPIMVEMFIHLQASFMEKVDNGFSCEMNTPLGRLLRTSTFDSNTFSNITLMDLVEKKSDARVKDYEKRLSSINDSIVEFLKFLFKSNQKDIFEWMYFMLQMNKNKSPDVFHQNNSSKGCMFNFISVMLNLCYPFCSNYSTYLSKFKRIEPQFIVSNLIDLTNLARMNSNIFDPTDFHAPDFNDIHFSGHLFFITHHLLYLTLVDELKIELKKKKDPNINKDIAREIALISYMFEDKFMKNMFSFLSFSSAYLLKFLDKNKGEIPPMALGDFFDFFELISEDSEAKEFVALPEYIAENIIIILKFYLCDPMRKLFTPEKIEEFKYIFGLFAVLQKTEFFESGILKGECGFILAQIGYPKMRQYKRDNPFVSLIQTKFSLFEKFLMEGIFLSFNKLETTKNDSLYIKKLESRIHYNYLIEILLRIEKPYAEQFIQIEKNQPDIFLKFANGFLTDVIFITEDMIPELEKNIEIEGNVDLASNILNLVQLDELRIYSLLLTTFFDTLKEITDRCQESFLNEIVINKFVTSLNFCLGKLVSKGLNYNEGKKQLINFTPESWIKRIIECFLNMLESDNSHRFCEELAWNDEPNAGETLKKIISLTLTNYKLNLNDIQLQKIKRLVSRIQEMKDIEEKLYDDAPNEFLDALTNKTLSRKPIDPYTNLPLNIEDVIPCPELKQRIEEYKKYKYEEYEANKEK